MDFSPLKDSLRSGDPAFWTELQSLTRQAMAFDELFLLSSYRKKALARGLVRPASARDSVRLAIVGGCSFYPLHELIQHLCDVSGNPVEIWLGAYDNYVAEIMDDDSGLYAFAPEVVLLLPSDRHAAYTGRLTDGRDSVEAEGRSVINSILGLARRLNERFGADVLLTNFILPARHDLGALRAKTLGSAWSYRSWLNLELGLNAAPFVHICDLAFLAHRLGGLEAKDDRSWYESKQPGSPALLASLAREAARLIVALKQPPKKVLALDLDNTLWGGVVADDGLEGIELGDTSPRGEAFKAFQRYILSLKERGVLLAVCSKNDHERAAEAFEKHPEMVLRLPDIVSFRANWEPKSENIRAIAKELNLGVDSVVFVDDNPAEIEIVRQFVPEASTILLGPDPAEYVGQLQDCGYFMPAAITTEDVERTAQYQAEAQRVAFASSVTDMDSYLESLQMLAVMTEFNPIDVPRVSQLINKSNQFNLTTRRRSEAEVAQLIDEPDHIGFSVRLGDRFGDHGLISVLIGKKIDDAMIIDTWIMSCRVLKRQVEEEALAELARLAQSRGCVRLVGIYLPTAKNSMVRNLYTRLGFTAVAETEHKSEYELRLPAFQPMSTKIKIARRAYGPI